MDYHFVKLLTQFDFHQEEKGEEGGGTVVKMVERMAVIFVLVWTINFKKISKEIIPLFYCHS